ncbi:MAG TPA: xanthine dehydrogenase family protein molybdopterin-binding subunit [Candidatus Binatia bacterium]|nr:xanthine dehydrogenase family protein molybdopterin-binding subunit [Candidatus Binatia bacterium]
MTTFTRKEDEELLQGLGRFVADQKIPHMLEAAFVRSPYAHAEILALRLDKARQCPGIWGVFTGADLPTNARQLPNAGRQPSINSITDLTLADSETRYVGEAVAVVLAENRYLAEDAAELVEVDYEPLPVVATLESALDPATPLVHAQFGSNLVGEKTWETGDVDAAFASADFVLDETFKVHRGTSSPMEPRGLIAVPAGHGSGSFRLEIIASTQSPYRLRDSLAEMLQIPAREIRVRSDCVGGGFGPKSGFYAEDFVIAWLALKSGRPVRWLEDRREHLLCARQERDQIHDISVAFSKTGKIVGLKDKFICDVGAFSTTIIIPWTTAYTLAGSYKISNLHVHMQLAFTHKVPTMTVRGAGRPEAIFVIERVLDHVAAKLDLDPLEIRRSNMIQPEDLPWNTGLTSRDGERIVYENVDVTGALEKVAAHIEYARLRKQFAQENGQAKIRRGVGIASYVVTTGRGPYELARARLDSNGQVIIYTGACPQGQGHHTSLAQVCARELAIAIDNVKIVSSDTETIQEGFGTFASRSAVTAGNAVAASAQALRDQLAKKIAAALGHQSDEICWDAGYFTCAGRRFDFAEALEIVKREKKPAEPTLFPMEASARFETKGHTYAAGAHGAVVEVDVDAGTIKIVKCVAAHEAGTVINSTIVEGQLHGGVAHGIGNALLERMVYDENGQMLSSTFKDYLLPLSTDVGDIDVLILETPARGNPLGIKGVGESGAVGVAPAVAAAVEHALGEFGVKVNSFPINPADLAQWDKGPGK